MGTHPATEASDPILPRHHSPAAIADGQLFHDTDFVAALYQRYLAEARAYECQQEVHGAAHSEDSSSNDAKDDEDQGLEVKREIQEEDMVIAENQEKEGDEVNYGTCILLEYLADMVEEI